MWREHSGAKPPAEKVECSRVAVPSVDRRRTEGATAKRVDESNGRPAHGHGSNRQSANRKAESDGGTPKREQQAEGRAADRDEATRETAKGHAADREVSYSNDAFGHSWTLRHGVNAGADVNQRPAAERDGRPVLEPEHSPLLHARLANQPRGIAADTLAAHCFLAPGTETYRSRAIVHEAVQISTRSAERRALRVHQAPHRGPSGLGSVVGHFDPHLFKKPNAESASMKGPLESKHTSSERSVPGLLSHPGARSERVFTSDRSCSFTPAPGT